jgi:putative membrane protein
MRNAKNESEILMTPIQKSLWMPLSFALILSSVPALAADEPAAAPSDPEIAHIVVTANQVDVDAGKLAKSRTKNAEVKKFAEQMITDHTAVNKQATELAGKLHVKPADNAVSKSLKDGGDKNMADLKKRKGEDFDHHYVDHEVAYHQAVLDAIDKTLIPSAKNAELKALIEKVRPAIAAHLEHAKMMQKSMGGAQASS